MKFRNAVKKYAAPLVLSVSSPMALAQTTISTTPVTEFLEDQVITGIAAIGGVMLLVAVVMTGYRWVRGSASGN